MTPALMIGAITWLAIGLWLAHDVPTSASTRHDRPATKAKMIALLVLAWPFVLAAVIAEEIATARRRRQRGVGR